MTDSVPTLYEWCGGFAALRRLTDVFYKRVLDDPQLKAYFDGVDMTTLRAHQAKLLVQVTGGPVGYEGRELAAAHAGLDITSADFERVVAHLAGTLTEMGVDAAVVGDVGAAVDGYRDSIVSAGERRA